MKTLGHVVIAFVTRGAEWAATRAELLREHGALVRMCAPQRDLWAALSEGGLHAIVIADVGREPPASAVVHELDSDPRTRGVPTLVLLPKDQPVVVTSGFSEMAVSFLGASAPDDVLVRTVADLATSSSRVRDLEGRARALEIDLELRANRAVELRRQIQTLAHDVRVLLGIIVGFACNLRDEAAGPMTPSQQEHVRRVLDAAQDASNLLEQAARSRSMDTLAAVTVPSAAAAEPSAPAPSRAPRAHRTLVDIATIVAQVARLFEDAARERGIAVAVTSEGAVHAWADSMQIKQVVTNLLVNAIKYSPRGGSVSVLARRAIPSDAANDGPGARAGAEIVVTDSGPGIPEEDRERVFNEGFRLERDVGIPGSGVGLAVVKQLVGLHGGRVRIEDAAAGARGCAFVVSLPIDLRVRARGGFLVVREEDRVQAIIQAMASSDYSALTAMHEADPDAFLRTLTACEAMVVLPRDGAYGGGIDDAMEGARAQAGSKRS